MTTTKTMTITEANRAYPNHHITAGEYIVVTTWTDDRGGKSDMLTAGGPTEDEALAEAQRLLDEGYISPDGDDTVYLVVRDETAMTTTTPRARITSDAGYPNRCTLRTTDECGQPVERHFFAPVGGGYVRENWSNPRQVCEHLSGGGSTLVWNPDRDETLADLIRRERAAGLRADRAMWRRAGY